jgi:hypothetical protein
MTKPLVRSSRPRTLQLVAKHASRPHATGACVWAEASVSGNVSVLRTWVRNGAKANPACALGSVLIASQYG